MAFAGLSSIASAATLQLNFGSVQAGDFGSDSLEVRFANVSSGINASLFAADTFASGNRTNNGSAQGDLRVNLTRGQTVQLTLQLWDATQGGGYSVAYAPGTNFDWSLVFYDIDGQSSNYWDEITLITPGTYTVTNPTPLNPTVTSEGYVSFSGRTAGDVPGQDGLTTFTEAQARVAVIYEVENTSSVTWIYSVVGDSGTQRNMLVDGGSLTFDGVPNITTTTSTVVPEPDAAVLVGSLALGALVLRRRRR